MRKSKVAAKLREHRFVRMAALGHVVPSFIKQAAHFGYDGIWLDLEHRTMSEREVQMLMAYAHEADIDMMVRTPTLEKSRLYRHMEDGATGLMIPHCSTPEKARMVVDAIKFPPLGDRGIDGAGLDGEFLTASTATYPEDANRETFLVCQIETVEAVKNAAAIAAVDGVDVLFIGPGDLGLRLRHDPGGMTMDDAIEQVRDACAKHGKAWGITGGGSVEELARRRSLGALLVPWGGDYMAIRRMLEQCGAELDALD